MVDLTMTQSEIRAPSGPDIRVIGPPRSGTNLVKYLIEFNTDLTCWFNRGWWKHAIIPPLMQQTTSIAAATPTIILFRDPLLQMASFYKFARKGRAALGGTNNPSGFLRSPIEMSPNKDYKYTFSNPINYWVQFYFSALNWNMDNKYFVELEKLQKHPRKLRSVLYSIFDSKDRAWPAFETPKGYLRRNPDQHIFKRWAYEDTTLLEEEQATQAILADFNPEDRALVSTERVIGIYTDLCARSCI